MEISRTSPEFRESIERAFRQISEPLLLFLRAHVGTDEVDDLRQEIVLTLLQKWNGEEKTFRAYAFNVAEKKILEHYRRRRHQGPPQENSELSPFAEFAAEITAVSQRTIRSELVEQILSAIQDEDERELLIFRGLLGWSHEDIGEFLGISPTASSSRWSRLRGEMAKRVSGDLPDWIAA